MMANANGEISSDKLIDLRVVDLRNELEKRGLDKSGVKAVLLERLEQAMKSEGGSLEHTEGSKEKSDTVSINASDLEKKEVLSEDKLQEESEPTDVVQKELTPDNMDEKKAETSNEASTDVFSNITKPDTDTLLPGKTSVEDHSEDQLVPSDTKPSDVLGNDTFDKDQIVEELPATTLDTNKEADTALQEESDDPLKDTTAPPEESSSSAETNTKEEKSEMSSSTENNTKEENNEMSLSAENNTKEESSEMSSSTENNSKEENSEKNSLSASVKSTTPSQKCNELKGDKVVKTALSDSLSSTPSVQHKAPFALKNTDSMDTSTTQQSEENESLIVHVDDTQNDLDADLVTSKDKVSGKTVVKKTDGSTVEERAKGKTEGGQTEKKADEKKDDKDVKSKSSSVSKPKVLRSIKSNNQNSRNLWVSGLAASTRATDLKILFTTYGKVVGAKVVTNARSPGARCYGFVTMSTAHEASKCIQHLNQTELHGRVISVERAKNEPGAQIIKMPEKKAEKTEMKKDEKKDGDKKEGVKKVDKKEPKKDDKDKRLPSRRDDRNRRIYNRRNDKDRKIPIRKDDKKRPGSSSSSSQRKPSDKTRVITPNKTTSKPATSLKPTTKAGSEKSAGPASAGSTKEKVSSTSKPKPQGPSASSANKDSSSFDPKIEKERQRLRQRRRRFREHGRRRLRKLGQARLIQQDFDRQQDEKALKLERVREDLRRERQKLEKELLQTERYKLAQEFLERERVREEQHRAEMLRLEEMRRSMKRPYEEELWDEPKRSRMSNSNNTSRFELPFQNESRYREYEHTDDERRVERYERRESRALEGGSRFDERKEREMMRRDVGHVRNMRERDERRTDVRSRTDENLNRMPYEFRRDTGLSRERFIAPDQGRDTDRRNISAHDRLGRVRSSPVGGPDQRPAWGSGSVDRKVDNWSHMHGDIGNSGMNRSNGRWLGNPMNTTGRDASGAFVDSGRPGNSEGMGQNLGPGSMFGNSQSQGGIMMNTHGGGNFGGNNMSGRMQQPRFDA